MWRVITSFTELVLICHKWIETGLIQRLLLYIRIFLSLCPKIFKLKASSSVEKTPSLGCTEVDDVKPFLWGKLANMYRMFYRFLSPRKNKQENTYNVFTGWKKLWKNDAAAGRAKQKLEVYNWYSLVHVN